MAMDIVRDAMRLVTNAADATTAAAGAVGGAAINGIVGGVQGAAAGVRSGLSAGSHSTPAALLTIGAIGATGLVEWPVLLGVGGTALLVHRLATSGGDDTKPTASAPRKTAPRKTAPRKTTRSTSTRSRRTSRNARPARAAARKSS